METSTYDSCLLITSTDNSEIGIIEMQTDDTLILGNTKFLAKKQAEIDKAGFSMKPAQILNSIGLLTFNGCTIIMDRESFYMLQKG